MSGHKIKLCRVETLGKHCAWNLSVLYFSALVKCTEIMNKKPVPCQHSCATKFSTRLKRVPYNKHIPIVRIKR